MKRYFRIITALVLGAIALASCSEKEEALLPERADGFYATVEDCEVSKVYADAQRSLHWNADDRIAVFNRSTAASEYRFDGSDGDVSGWFSLVSEPAASGTALSHVYAVYPYGNDASVSADGEIALTFPASQNYVSGSFDPAANLMVAKTNTDQLLFHNVGGILSLSFKGDGISISAVELKGNAGELLSGPAKAQISADEVTVTMQPEAAQTVRLVCKEPLELSLNKTSELWFVLPPVNFTQGFTATLTTSVGQIVFSTEKPVTVRRGVFARMNPVREVTPNPWPVLNTGLRSVFVETPGGVDITSKDYWTEGCTVVIVDDTRKEYYRNAEVSMKGRGNTTWGFDKKPYTFKLPSKDDLIGVGAKGKRWVLLANWMDRTLLRNEVAFEIARRTSIEWTPSGEFVELFLNGKHLGNYWLGEQIKIGKGRVSGDYLLEMDVNYDEDWRFYSEGGIRVNQWAWGMPINIKDQSSDEMTDAQFTQVQNLVAGVENAIYYGGDYASLIDVNSFIDWYLVHELTGNEEPNHPKSCYFYFRDGKMYAGPVWDFDWYTFHPDLNGLCIRYCIYYDQLLQDPTFVAALKARWAELKPRLSDIPDFIDQRANHIRVSESINHKMWPNSDYNINGDCTYSFSRAISRMKQSFTDRLSTLDTAIEAL